MVGPIAFPALIQELHSELNQSSVTAVPANLPANLPANVPANQPANPHDRWHTRAHEIVGRKLHSPFEFLEWAKRDRHWSFTLAEIMGKMCAKPSELAA